MSEYRGESGLASPIVAHRVAQVRILADALNENVLVTVRGPSGGEETLSLSPDIAGYVETEIAQRLQENAVGESNKAVTRGNRLLTIALCPVSPSQSPTTLSSSSGSSIWPARSRRTKALMPLIERLTKSFAPRQAHLKRNHAEGLSKVENATFRGFETS